MQVTPIKFMLKGAWMLLKLTYDGLHGGQLGLSKGR